MIFLSASNLFASNTCILSYTQLRRSNTQPQHKTDWLQLTVVCYILPFYSPTSSVKRKFLKWKVLVLVLSITLLRAFVYGHSHTSFSLMFVVGGLFKSCSMYIRVYVLCICRYICIGVCICLYIYKGIKIMEKFILKTFQFFLSSFLPQFYSYENNKIFKKTRNASQ